MAPYIGASVDDETKAEWEEYVEESQYGSMSELVRAAVRKEIHGSQQGQEASRSDGTEGPSVELDRLHERQQTILDQVESVEEAVEAAAEEQEQTEYPEEIVELGHQIASDLDRIQQSDYGRMDSEVHMAMREVAEERNADVTDVQAAFDYLEQNVPWIQKKPTPPSEYYRVEG